ncbi:hypothetical protein [Chloroflexus sp.]|uniref:hypothetical protein n=1 Tax=Chloroflexus sp. TaxID=1904827 RepID=UPI002ACEB7AD|nr:hypothetical protein [Chloroflexus sp.]
MLPPNAAVVVVADRAVGCPAFTDHVAAHGWDGVVRVQGQPRWQDRHGRIHPIRMPIRSASERWKGAGQVLKAAGWRPARIVARWGTVQQQPLLMVCRLPVS